MGGTAVVISREELKERLKLGRPLRVNEAEQRQPRAPRRAAW